MNDTVARRPGGKLRRVLPLAAMYAANGLVYGFNALYYCFIQLYLEQYHNPVNVGILLAIGPAVSIVAPLFWGVLADRSRNKNVVLLIAVAGSAVCFCALAAGHSFWYLFAMLTVLMCFLSPFAGLIDTVTLEYTTAHGVAYGPIRLTGTFVFGLIPLVLTNFTETNLNIIFYAYAVLTVLCAAALLGMPRIPGHAAPRSGLRLGPLFRDRRLMLIFLSLAVAQFSWGYYQNFFPTYLIGTLGLSQRVWGVNVLVTVLGEIPFFLFFSQLYRRPGIRALLILSMALSVVRYAALALGVTSPVILGNALITGAAITVATYCGSVYIARNVPAALQATGQTVMYALCSGIPKVLAGLAGGRMTASLGVPTSMLLCAGLCALALVPCLAGGRRLWGKP